MLYRENVSVSQDELEDVLEELYGAGTFDSSGSFSVRADKAREKLANFRLQNPYSYIVHLYSFGYMSGAQEFSYSLGVRSSWMKFRGASFDPGMWDDIFSYLLFAPQNSREWAAHELALGLHSGTAAGVKRAVLNYGRRTAVVEGDRVFSRTTTDEDPLLSIVLYHRRPLSSLLSGLILRRPPPEDSVLEEAATSELWLEPLQAGRWIRRHQEPPKPPATAVLNLRDRAGFVALGVGDDLGKAQDSEIALSIRGRRFPLPIKFGKGKIVALHTDDTLSLDLSQSAPLQNDGFLRVRRALMERVGEVRSRLLVERPEVLTDRERRTLVRQVSRNKRTRAELQEAHSTLGMVKFNESRVAALSAMEGRLEESAQLLRDQLDRAGLPQGLRPDRLLDLATVEARLGKSSAFETWNEGYRLMESQHLDRKGHLVAEALESKLLWSSELGQDPEAAWSDWELARELKKHLGPEHPRLAETLERGAYLKWLQGSYEEALNLSVEALLIRIAHQGEGNPACGQALTLKALAEKKLGLQEALKTANLRLSLMEAVYGPDHPETAASLYLQARVEQQGVCERASQILATAGVAAPSEGKSVVCFRGWFHSRAPWCCCYPLEV